MNGSKEIPAKDVKVFGDLEQLLESKRSVNGLSNSETIKMNYEKGLYLYPKKMPLREYERIKLELQSELLKVQNWVRIEGERIVSIFEGRDAEGKGGTIKRYMEHLNPRAAHVVALEKSTEREKGQWYFQRYIKQLPTEGEMTFFDRSWYNRAGARARHGVLHFSRVPGVSSPMSID